MLLWKVVDLQVLSTNGAMKKSPKPRRGRQSTSESAAYSLIVGNILLTLF